MSVRTLACSAVVAICSAVLAPAARADFTLVSQDLTINRQAATAAFALTFNQAPDFKSVAADGAPADSFQVEFYGAVDPVTSLPDDLTAVVRGDEIAAAHALRVRAPTGDGGPGSGGWGPVVGTVPFQTFGDTVSFVIPTADLGYAGGAWQASAYSLSAGALTAQQSVSSIPTPPAFWSGLVGLVSVAVWQWRQSIVRRRAAHG